MVCMFNNTWTFYDLLIWAEYSMVLLTNRQDIFKSMCTNPLKISFYPHSFDSYIWFAIIIQQTPWMYWAGTVFI